MKRCFSNTVYERTLRNEAQMTARRDNGRFSCGSTRTYSCMCMCPGVRASRSCYIMTYNFPLKQTASIALIPIGIFHDGVGGRGGGKLVAWVLE